MKKLLTEKELVERAQWALASGEYASFALGGARVACGSRKYKNGQFVRNVNPHKSRTNKYCFVGGLRWRDGGGYCVVNPYGELITLDNIRGWDEELSANRLQAFKNVEEGRRAYDDGCTGWSP